MGSSISDSLPSNLRPPYLSLLSLIFSSLPLSFSLSSAPLFLLAGAEFSVVPTAVIEMEANNISVQETCRRRDFEESDDLPISSEAQAENHEDKIENQMGTDTCQTIDAIHACISKKLIPEIGMEFETEDDAHQFYLSYAKAVGFGVRISKLHKDKETDHVWDRVFLCSREGGRKKDIRDASVKKHHPLTRCHCSAKMKISCRQANKYRIVKFIAEHSHACVTPSKSHMFRSHQRMTKAQRPKLMKLLVVGLLKERQWNFWLNKPVDGNTLGSYLMTAKTICVLQEQMQ